MIELPDFSRSFEYENNFYLSCDSSRISKIIAQYELFKKTLEVPGAIVECGVFKGSSLARFAMFRELLMGSLSKKIIAFDTFGQYPETQFDSDKKYRERFIQTAGEEGISKEQLVSVLQHKGVYRNAELVEGDITRTVPEYVKQNPELKISLLNLDTDVYEPAVTILEHLFPRMAKGGILLVDDYGVFAGENRAVDEYFEQKEIQIRKLPFAQTPCYIVT